ncbi:efflux RND transporter periplasmic adaptor subunit [Pseudoalteromonas denitrificans]|uniref:Membrane fusion protein, multidrug efflux system n=1 Tax=Pseudoalteromonas denitrificans DSM 6059 TaxID=1123010 RepID=A0A1I1IQ43_9GAMM|nr:efflux RND transporter periplasmic adaptor subunit [Pseudoalteromonas denitrificans]SFC35360.1 membrane fusion protein, multidrug efflux system [Pseudoalteromonas denitrificans DSM 6059]
MLKLHRIRQLLDEKPYIIALSISLGILLWMLSGNSHAQDPQSKTDKKTELVPLAKVKVETLQAQQIFKTLTLYGKSEPDKISKISAREEGEVKNIFVKEGQFVEKGTVILTLDQSDLNERIISAKSLLVQRKLEYKGFVKLKQQGLQDEVKLSQSKAQLEHAKSDLASLKLSLSRSEIKAPFSGVINRRLVEIGDYLGRGDPILELADLDPLIVRADVTQSEIFGLNLNQEVKATLINKKSYKGNLRYIASVADDNTNTFRIEAQFDNPSMKIRAGFSTQLDIDFEAINAIHISPAFMALDPMGSIGVKTINDKNEVVFSPINVVKSTADGIWMSGLGDEANVITLGQGFVRIGDIVEPVFSADETIAKQD